MSNHRHVVFYYGRALDHNMFLLLNQMSMTQAQPKEKPQEECQQLMDYAAAHPHV